MAALRPDGTMAPAQGRKPLVPITETPSQGGPANLAAETPSASDVQDHFSQEMPDRLSKYYERSPSLAPSYFKRGGVQTGLGEVNGGVSGDPEYYRSLGKAAQAALIHLIMKYHETLLQKGLTAEAEKISSSLKALRDDPIGDANKELTGMDLLMKDGLLQYMLKIGPLLPTLPAQVVTFKNLSYSSKVTFTKGTYETVGTQVIGLGTQFVTKKTTGDVDILKNVTGYVMPGTMTLVLGGPGSGKSTLQSLLSGMPHKDKTTTIKGEVRYNGKHVIGGPSESAGFAVRKLAALVKQSDVHFAALSVRETLEFARSCTQVWTFEEMFRRSPELREVFGAVLAQGKDPKLENVINILGLRRVLNMPVGGPMTPPTLTEDERRRVSAAEMVAGTYVLLFLDAFATGVDAATAYDIASGLRVLARVRQLGIVANIVNPPPEVFGLFDRVILLDRGRVVYQGPRADAVPHFESLGYIKPDFLDITEFLQEVTSPDGAQWLSPGHSPLDLGGFVSAYEATPHYADILRVVNSADPPHVLSVKAPKPLGLNLLARNGVPAIARIEASSSLTSAEQTVHFTGAVKEGDVITAVSAPEGGLVYLAGKGGEASVEELEARLHEAADPVRLQLERATPEPDDKDIINEQFTQEYSLPFWAEYRFLFDRAWKAQLRGKLLLYFRAFQITFISLFVGTIFWQLNESADFAHMNTRRGVGFLSLMSTFLCNAIQLPGQLADRAVFYKQQGARFYRPGSYLLASVAANFPFSCLEALTYGVIVYFMTGLSLHEGSGHFWLFLLVIFLNVQQGALLVRWLSSFAPAMETAAALQGIFIVIFVAFAGFLVPRNKIPDWWIWAYWMDPLQWGISIIMINEMRSATYKQPCASFTPQYLLAHTLTGPCRQAPDRELGFAYLVQWQLKTSWYWVPIGVVVYLTWCALWLGLSYVALSEIRHVVVPKVRPLAARKGSAAPEVKAGNPEKETATTHDAEKGANIKPCMTSLHFLPVTLSWHDLSHSVVIPGVGESKNVLSYVSGWAKPGRLLALMSSGGAAKSLLLRVLAGKMVPGRTTGQILVNGYPRNPATFRRYCTMVERVESHSPFMTVREAIQFSARLRLPGTTTESQREAFIDQILDVMELRPFKNVLVGSLGKAGVTLANAHKLTVAVELAANPSTLLMDDPLSGLDSRSAVHVLHCIKNAAVDCGRTVVCTVTQPGARCLGVFDDLLLLNAAGETCYFGELGYRGQKLISYFEGIPGTPRIDRDVNPATYALGVTGAGIDPSRTGGNHTFRDYAFEYRVSDLAFSQVGEIESLRRGKGKLGDEPSLMGPAAPYARQFWEIVLRMQRYHYRNLHYSWARVMSSVILGLILGSIFLNISYHTTPGMQARGGFVFIILVINAVGNAQNAAGQVLSQRPVHRREVGNGMYTFAFANVAWALAEVPYLAISTLVFCSIACTMANIVTGSFGTFLQFWFTLYMFCLAVTYFGMLVAAVSPTPVHSSVIVTCITSMWIATAGLVLPRVLIPDVYIWVYWTNPFQYALQGMTSVAFFCDTTTAACSAPGCATRSCPGCDCTRLSDNPSFVWTALKSQRNLHEGQAKWDIFYLFLFCVAFRLLTWVALKTLKHNRA